MMPILSFPRGRLQAGDQIVFHIHTHVSFITVEIFHMMDISALLIFGRFLAFAPILHLGHEDLCHRPFGLDLWSCLHCLHYEHSPEACFAINNLNTPKRYPRLLSHLYDFCQ